MTISYDEEFSGLMLRWRGSLWKVGEENIAKDYWALTGRRDCHQTAYILICRLFSRTSSLFTVPTILSSRCRSDLAISRVKTIHKKKHCWNIYMSVLQYYVLDEQQKEYFTGWINWCEIGSQYIPLSFLLGFFVSVIVARW